MVTIQHSDGDRAEAKDYSAAYRAAKQLVEDNLFSGSAKITEGDRVLNVVGYRAGFGFVSLDLGGWSN